MAITRSLKSKSGLPEVGIDNDFIEGSHDPYYGYKRLARKVISQAIYDMRNSKSLPAIRFLSSQIEEYKKIRCLWLSWLDIDDEKFQIMIRAKTHHGHKSKTAHIFEALDGSK